MMSKRGLTNVALLVAALGIGLFLREQRRPIQPHVLPKLAAIKAAAITEITIARPGKAPIRLTRTGNQWFLQKPFRARANPFRVAALTDVADATPQDRFAAPKTSLKNFGLSPPQAILTLNHKRILIGKRRPFGDLRYILTHHTIALVPAQVIHPRRLSSDSFLSTRLLGQHLHPVAFRLPHFTVMRKQGIWRVAPQPRRISNDHINTFVDEWRYARALSVTRYHGGRPIGQIVIQYEGAGSQKAGHKPRSRNLIIDILATQPELVLLRPDQKLEYHFPTEVGRHLLHLSHRARTS